MDLTLDYKYFDHLFVKCHRFMSPKPTYKKSENIFWTMDGTNKVNNKELAEKGCTHTAPASSSPLERRADHSKLPRSHLSNLTLRLRVCFPWLKIQFRFE